jgi:Tfp pilus assembly PilM family ATPase
MHTSTFFRLFPPPKFLVMKHAGLDISDDEIHSLTYGSPSSSSGWRDTIGTFSTLMVPENIIQDGDIKDTQRFIDMLADFGKKAGLSYVKVSVPEEKAYLFQTNVPGGTISEIRQNIEFKLEENVPLAVADAVFYYDLLPLSVTSGVLRASVSVVPRTYIEHNIELLSKAHLFPISFEVVPKAIARAIVPPHSDKTILILHMMNQKTGIYIVSGGVVSFTSTIGIGSRMSIEEGHPSYTDLLSKEIDRVYSYWSSREGNTSSIGEMVLVGRDAVECERALADTLHEIHVPIGVANTWHNTLDLNHYVPPISKVDSLSYVVAAGLAMDH